MAIKSIIDQVLSENRDIVFIFIFLMNYIADREYSRKSTDYQGTDTFFQEYYYNLHLKLFTVTKSVELSRV